MIGALWEVSMMVGMLYVAANVALKTSTGGDLITVLVCGVCAYYWAEALDERMEGFANL